MLRRTHTAFVAALASAFVLSTAGAAQAERGTPGLDEAPELPAYNCGGCSSAPPEPSQDTDGDLLMNGTERDGEYKLRFAATGDFVRRFPSTDPYDPDTDSDGLDDFYEVARYVADYSGRNVVRRFTNPRIWDSDRDGYSDGFEVKYTRTDPTLADTDRDGLSDRDEGMTYRTNARKADTDGDCIPDGTEIAKGTDPNRRAPATTVGCAGNHVLDAGAAIGIPGSTRSGPRGESR